MVIASGARVLLAGRGRAVKKRAEGAAAGPVAGGRGSVERGGTQARAT